MSSFLNQTRFFMHAAHAKVGLVTSEPGRPVAIKTVTDSRKTLRVCLAPGAKDDGWDESARQLTAYLSGECRFECRSLGDHGKNCAAAVDAIRNSDCLVLMGRPALSDNEWLEQLKQYCESGRPLVALRSASQTFCDWPGLDRKIFGGEYRGRHNTAFVHVSPAGAAREHPILAGVGPFFAHGYLHKVARLAWDAKLLLTGSADGQFEPVAWFCRRGGDRVFYTSLGHSDDFRQPSFLRLLGSAIRWVS